MNIGKITTYLFFKLTLQLISPPYVLFDALVWEGSACKGVTNIAPTSCSWKNFTWYPLVLFVNNTRHSTQAKSPTSLAPSSGEPLKEPMWKISTRTWALKESNVTLADHSGNVTKTKRVYNQANADYTLKWSGLTFVKCNMPVQLGVTFCNKCFVQLVNLLPSIASISPILWLVLLLRQLVISVTM